MTPNKSDSGEEAIAKILLNWEFSVTPQALEELEKTGDTSAGHLAMMQDWLHHPLQQRLIAALTAHIQAEKTKERSETMYEVIGALAGTHHPLTPYQVRAIHSYMKSEGISMHQLNGTTEDEESERLAQYLGENK